jgi:hypothetical protein
VTFTATLPADLEAGSHRVVLTGATSGSVERTFTLTSSGTLATTGASGLIGPVGLGGCVALGLALFALRLGVVRRRQA